MLLASRPGELVTREEIKESLWGKSTYVDSEHGINSAIRRIRAALGEDSEQPKYIETVVRRGYRFIAPLTHAAPPAVAEPDPIPQPPRNRRRIFVIAAAAVVVVAVLIGALVERQLIRDPPPQLSWKPLTGPVHVSRKIVSDGKNVYWTELDASGCRPWQVSLEGGEMMPVRSPLPRGWVEDASPEGELLLVVPDNCYDADFLSMIGPLWAVDASTGRARRLSGVMAHSAVWSPGPAASRRLAFARLKELWIARADGSEPRRIATLPGAPAHMHWSPDGGLLRFSLHRDADFHFPLWELEIATGHARAVLPEWNDSSEDFAGVWLPPGDFLFDSRRPFSTDLWQMTPAPWPASGHRLAQLTHGPLEFSNLAQIPGRADLALVGQRLQGELERFDRTRQEFVPFLNGASAQMVDFSRDGQWVAWVSHPARELWRSRADGTEALQLTHGTLSAGTPHISPDGRTVAFVGDYAGKQLRPWLVPFDGGEPKPVGRLEPETAQVGASWSPDGKKLLIRLDRPGQPHVLQFLDLASGNTETLPGSENKFEQRWSPDGKWVSARPYDRDLLEVFSLETKQWKTLARMSVAYLCWSRDSASLVFVARSAGGEEAIYRVSLAGKLERVTGLAGITRAQDPVYDQWLGLTPDGSPLILKNTALKQIYLLSLSR